MVAHARVRVVIFSAVGMVQRAKARDLVRRATWDEPKRWSGLV